LFGEKCVGTMPKLEENEDKIELETVVHQLIEKL
jgi:hypothetical protein